MKTFLAVFLGSDSSPAAVRWNALDEKEKARLSNEGIQAWHAWIDKHNDVIVDGGTPLGKTKQISVSGVTPTKNQLTAYTIVRAPSHEQAAELFLNHPHFTIFPGDTVEVMECLPIPTK